jgi:endoplasmic reticulum-Golgi intermediate compartment protein 2
VFNFSHHINELSFGPYYPRLENPLDNTVAYTDKNFYKFQYYANIVPTIYTTDVHRLKLSPHEEDASEPLTNMDSSSYGVHGSTVWTNQYAVTSQSRQVPETSVPGVFFKYDIEPILLVINEERGGFLALLVRLVNVISGVLVAGTWLWQFSDWALESYGKGGGRERLGFLGTRDEKYV